MEEKSFVQRIKETMLDIPAKVQRRKYEAEEGKREGCNKKYFSGIYLPSSQQHPPPRMPKGNSSMKCEIFRSLAFWASFIPLFGHKTS